MIIAAHYRCTVGKQRHRVGLKKLNQGHLIFPPKVMLFGQQVANAYTYAQSMSLCCQQLCYNVSVLGWEEGYPSGLPRDCVILCIVYCILYILLYCIQIRTRGGICLGICLGIALGQSLELWPYFIIYPDLSPNTDIIPFLTMIYRVFECCLWENYWKISATLIFQWKVKVPLATYK